MQNLDSTFPQRTPTATHSSHTHMSSDSTNRLYCTHHTHRYRRIVPACIAPELASRRGRCWSKCHGWVNPKKGRHHTATLVGWAAFIRCLVPGRRSPGDTWPWEGPERTDMRGIQQLEESTIGALSHPRFGHYSTPIWERQSGLRYLHIPPSSPPETSSLSHADEPRDHPHTHYNCTSTHNGKDPTCIQTQAYTRTLTHSLSWRVKATQEPSRTANELIWRTNYNGNERRRDRRVGDSGLEERKAGRKRARWRGEEEEEMDFRGIRNLGSWRTRGARQDKM